MTRGRTRSAPGRPGFKRAWPVIRGVTLPSGHLVRVTCPYCRTTHMHAAGGQHVTHTALCDEAKRYVVEVIR